MPQGPYRDPKAPDHWSLGDVDPATGAFTLRKTASPMAAALEAAVARPKATGPLLDVPHTLKRQMAISEFTLQRGENVALVTEEVQKRLYDELATTGNRMGSSIAGIVIWQDLEAYWENQGMNLVVTQSATLIPRPPVPHPGIVNTKWLVPLNGLIVKYIEKHNRSPTHVFLPQSWQQAVYAQNPTLKRFSAPTGRLLNLEVVWYSGTLAVGCLITEADEPK